MANNDNLRRFGAYVKALELFDHVVADLTPLMNNPALHRLVSQQFASADSVASTIEEGYGGGSRKEYVQFLVIARGSAQETGGRYGRFKHWLPESVIEPRIALSGEIVGILTGTIKTLRERA
jgi:four helix bundle protein